jgi:hypothetical protein
VSRIRRLWAAARQPAPPRGYVCRDCGTTVATSWPGEAVLLAGLHDQLVHNARTTASVGVAA